MKSNLITISQDKSTRQEIQAKHGSGSSGHRDRDKEAKKRAAIGNAVRGLFPSGHNRQDRYNDVRIKITLFTLSLHIPLYPRKKDDNLVDTSNQNLNKKNQRHDSLLI